MKVAQVVALLGLLAMTGIILYAFAVGDFNKEGTQLLAMPWGQVSMLDLYVGFILFSGWIIYREKSLARSVIWIILMMVLGNWRPACTRSSRCSLAAALGSASGLAGI